MLSFCVLVLAALAGCQDTPPQVAPPKPAIEARDATGVVIGKIVPGHPCRALVEGVEVLVGGPPLVAQLGTDRFTGETAENGTTLRKNDQIVARIHAKQLFDANGIPIIRVLDNGDIADKANAVLRKATREGTTTKIGDLTITTTDFTVAAMLTAREVVPEIRALVTCSLLE